MSRILVIEDDPTSLDLMTYLLTAFGHTSISAVDGEAGIEGASREMPDLIVCDLQIPRIDGFGVVRWVKQQSTMSKIPVIAVTAFAMVGDRDKVLEAGFDGYISKPIDPELFVGQVEAFLGDELPSSRPAQYAMGDSQPTNYTGDRGTVLVLDNVQTNIDLARSILEPSGYTIIAASNVEQALTLARKYKPDLILSDVHLPELDGFNFLISLKDDPSHLNRPFIFISSTTQNSSDKRYGLSLGARKFLVRPIDPETLLAEIQACLTL